MLNRKIFCKSSFSLYSPTVAYNDPQLPWSPGLTPATTGPAFTAVSKSTQPCIPSESLNRVLASAGGKGGNVSSAGWQVTPCDPICHVSSRSGEATLANCYIRVTYLLTFLSAVRVWHAGGISAARRCLDVLVTPPPIGQRSIVMSVSVCLSVCVFVRDHIFGTARSIFTKFFCACYLWQWLGPPLAA